MTSLAEFTAITLISTNYSITMPKRDNSILQLKGTSNFSNFFLNDDKTLEGTKNFLNNLSPYFTPEYMVTKLCSDKEAAKQLFSALFLSEDEFKEKYNYKNNSIDQWRIAKGSTFLNYDDLVLICTSHLSEDSIEDDFFNQIYKNLTGNNKREFFKKGKISSDEIEKAFTALSCNRDADFKTVKLAYRKVAKEHHPDKGGNGQTFKLINEAYKILDKHFSQEEELINSSTSAKDSSSSSGSMKSDTSPASQDEVRSDKLSNYDLPPPRSNLVIPGETEQLPIAPVDPNIKPVSRENSPALSSNQIEESFTVDHLTVSRESTSEENSSVSSSNEVGESSTANSGRINNTQNSKVPVDKMSKKKITGIVAASIGGGILAGAALGAILGWKAAATISPFLALASVIPFVGPVIAVGGIVGAMVAGIILGGIVGAIAGGVVAHTKYENSKGVYNNSVIIRDNSKKQNLPENSLTIP